MGFSLPYDAAHGLFPGAGSHERSSEGHDDGVEANGDEDFEAIIFVSSRPWVKNQPRWYTFLGDVGFFLLSVFTSATSRCSLKYIHVLSPI